MKSQNILTRSPENVDFWPNTWLQVLSENFLEEIWPCSRYLKCLTNVVLSNSKKIRTIRRVDRKIFKEKWILGPKKKGSPGTTVVSHPKKTFFTLNVFFFIKFYFNDPRKLMRSKVSPAINSHLCLENNYFHQKICIFKKDTAFLRNNLKLKPIRINKSFS